MDMIGRRGFGALGATAVAWSTLPGAARAQSRERTVVVSSGNDVTSLAPCDAWIQVPDVALIEYICDPLMIRWKGDQIQPCLAESMRMVDDVTWEFKLRPGIEFHNGEKLTSEAFKLFFDVVNDPETRTNLRSTFAYVKEVTVFDDLTFRIITKEPVPGAMITLVFIFPIPPQYFASSGLAQYRRRPIGTGAFRLQERVADQRVVLVANDKYWGGRQEIRRVIYRPIREASSRAAALMAGEIDVAIDLPPELTSMLEGRAGIQVKKVVTARIMLLTLDFARPEMPTANVKVREAINYAIDRDSLVRDVLDGNGAPVAFCPPFVPGFNPANPPIKRDVARARRLLVEAGYPDGLEFELETPNGRYLKDKEVAEAIAGQMAEAGMRVTVRPLDWSLMQRRMYSGTGAPVKLSGYTFSGDVQLFNTNNLRSGAPSAAGSSPEMDVLIEQIAHEMKPERRVQLIHQQQELMHTVWPKAMLLQLGAITATSSNGDRFSPRWDDRIRLMTNTVLG
jgi:peptide/nickel transport system substrate-binding protein